MHLAQFKLKTDTNIATAKNRIPLCDCTNPLNNDFQHSPTVTTAHSSINVLMAINQYGIFGGLLNLNTLSLPMSCPRWDPRCEEGGDPE